MATSEAVAGVPHVEWSQFRPYFEKAWKQGEHITYVGPTGSGKTTLALDVVPIRKYVIVCATKPKDDTMDKLARAQRWPIVREWPPPRRYRQRDQVIVWPPFSRPGDERRQAQVLYETIVTAFAEGGWTIFADELWYFCKKLKLTEELETIWSQGRSVGVSLVGGTQRPAWVPLMAYDQATHLFFWRDNDETNLRRISGLGGLSSAAIRRTVSALPPHVALYLNTRTGQLATTLAPKP